MGWIAGFEERFNCIYPTALSKTGQYDPTIDCSSLNALPVDITEDFKQRNVTLNVSALTPCSAEIYLEAIRLPISEDSNRHQIFEYVDENAVRHLLPALSILKWFTASVRGLINSVFLPNFVFKLAKPIFEVGFLRWVRNDKSSKQLGHRLESTLSSPSLLKMWASAASYALQGALSFTPPDVVCHLQLNGFYFREIFIVTNVQWGNIRSVANAFCWLKNTSSSVPFIRKTRFDTEGLDLTFCITDSEWALLRYGPLSRDRPIERDWLNFIFLRLWTGAGWAELRLERPGFRAISAIESRWRKDGTWDEILGVLKTTRSLR